MMKNNGENVVNRPCTFVRGISVCDYVSILLGIVRKSIICHLAWFQNYALEKKKVTIQPCIYVIGRINSQV